LINFCCQSIADLDPAADISILLQEHGVKVYTTDTKHITDIINDLLVNNSAENAIYAVDLCRVIEQFKTWRRVLPDIEPYYAVKCNSDPLIVKLLAALGCNFDCASSNEIALVMSATNNDATRIIYANPCKQTSQIRFARGNDVDVMTFDSKDALLQSARYHPGAKMVMRIQVDDSKSLCKFNSKFGCDASTTRSLLEIAKALGIKLSGVSFHVGSGCSDATVFRTAIQSARVVFDDAKAMGFDMHILDIGGGFPGDDNAKFEEMAATIEDAITESFDDWRASTEFKVIAEPGRFMVTTSHTLVLNVICKKEVAAPTPERQFAYYLNDGVYGSFNCILFDHATPTILPFNERNEERVYKSVIYGPTCDSIDTIARDVTLPELAIGEWLYVPNMGAYTTAAASTFNGFPKPETVYIAWHTGTDLETS